LRRVIMPRLLNVVESSTLVVLKASSMIVHRSRYLS